MSACISRHGEYSSHEPDGDYTCTRCFVVDEAALLADRDRARDLAAALEAENARLRETLQDLAQHGLRCDLHPTMPFQSMSDLYENLTRYLRSADQSLRDQARRALDGAADNGEGR